LKPIQAALLALVSLLALVPVALATTSTSSSGASTGTVTYALQGNYNGTSHSATVTETVAADSNPGESIVSLAISGSMANFTYSRVVNSSLALLPYLPAISGNNYTYTAKTYSVSASIAKTGTSSVTFQGQSYTLSDYAFSATVTSTNGTSTISGTVSAFPSDLVYSVSIHSQDSSGSATLTSTSLPLSAASAAPALQATTAGIGLSIAAGAVVVSLGVKYRHKAPVAESKPDHWVD